MQADQTPQPNSKSEELTDLSALPQTGAELRLKQQVADALKSIPGGDQIDGYYGITSGNPEQPIDEAKESDVLIQGLRELSSGKGDLSDLLGRISEHSAASAIDPEALRALMRGAKEKAE